MQNLDCRYCRKTFYKQEHLKRHERSHTGSRPFVCQICNRPFGRQDSLLRHERLHNRQKASAYASPSPSTDTQVSASDDNIEQHPGRIETILSRNTDSSIEQHQPLPRLGAESIDPNLDHIFQPALGDSELIWPDSENLFQTLLASDPNNQWQMPLESMSLTSTPPLATSISHPSPSRFGDQPRSIESIPVDGNHRAVHGVSNMIHVQSSSITAAVDSFSINSTFLDECLHMFFVRFIPTLPILHRPTFVFRDCLHPLLLNAIAIGSLYLGHRDAVARGEVLWRLAHTALATSWQTMISHQGQYDERPGVQLLITALLGQIYGSLSKNSAVRMTSQAFHTMSFFWARQCGMLESENNDYDNIPTSFANENDKTTFWKRWVSKEIENRTLLAHYALDGLLARMLGEVTPERHIINRLPLPQADSAFMSNTADEFLYHLQAQQDNQQPLRQIFRQLFSPEETLWSYHSFSAFSLTVLLEGIQSKISDQQEDYEMSRSPGINLALNRTYQLVTHATNLSSAERLEARLRWHAVCLEAIVNTSELCKHLCHMQNIKQTLWSNAKPTRLDFNISQWIQTCDGRKALLHAVAIQDIVEELPRGRAHAIHMPAALLAAATICTVFCLAGKTTVNLPNSVDWNEVMKDRTDAPNFDRSMHDETPRFIRGEFDSGTMVFGAFRNLPYEFNSMQKLFRCLATQWGVATDMEVIVREWKTMFH